MDIKTESASRRCCCLHVCHKQRARGASYSTVDCGARSGCIHSLLIGVVLGGRRQPAVRARSTGVAYIKVHESEIADDYPEPAQYSAEEEEMDELVLFGEEEDYGAVAPDPDWLPRKTLQDFSVYNAEVCPHPGRLRLFSSFCFGSSGAASRLPRWCQGLMCFTSTARPRQSC